MSLTKNNHEVHVLDGKSNLPVYEDDKDIFIFINACVFTIYTLLFSFYVDFLLLKQILLFLFFFTYYFTCNQLKINYYLLVSSFLMVLLSFIFLNRVTNNYHLIPILYLVIFFYNNKNTSYYFKYFFLFTNYLVIFLLLLVFVNLLKIDYLKSTSFIVIGLPGLFYINKKFFFYSNTLILLAFSFYYLERQLFLILLFILILNFFKSLTNFEKIFFIVIFFKITFVITLVIYADDFYLNDLFSKRPLIFGYYFDFFSRAEIVSFIFGHGFLETKNDVFSDLEDILKFYRYRFNIFSPHNFILITFYTFGLFGITIIMVFLYKFFSLKKFIVEKKIMLVLLLLGVLQSFIFLGHQPLSIIFSSLFIILLKNYKNVSLKNKIVYKS
jgi:hypothetical protein